MKDIFRIFKVKKEERCLMLFVLLFLVFLHSLVIYKYGDVYTKPTRFYWTFFVRNFHLSGFDPVTYSIVSDWNTGYNVYRHPLLAFFMYPPYLFNQLLMWLTGKNCAIYVVAVMQTFWAFYSMLFFYRIVREIVTLGRVASTAVTLFFLSFGYVMLSCMSPDHFVISMCLLLMALYVAGKRMQSGREFKTWQTIVYFLLTAGVSLNNGLKVFLAGLFTNRRHFFRPLNLLLGVIVPALFLWNLSHWEYDKFVYPVEHARHIAHKKQKEAKAHRDSLIKLEAFRQDSILRAQGDTLTLLAKEAERKTEEHKKAEAKRKRGPKQGAPISNGQFMRWTDITSSRLDAVVENLFGESIQYHHDYLFGDVLRNRPMIVRYNWWINYVVEGIVVMLFMIGIWCGRRSRFMWLVLSFFGMDMALHIGLGFGINEVYIMSCHWIYAIPICIAYLLKRQPRLLALLIPLTCYLYGYNIALLFKYFV